MTHDIPVKVLRASEISNYRPPEVPAPSVMLELPRTRQLRTVVDRLKQFDQHVLLQGDMDGRLSLRVEGAQCTVKTHFTNLSPRFEGMDEQQSRRNKAGVRVDARKLSGVLGLYNAQCSSAIVCFSQGHSLILHAFLSPEEAGTLTYYLPVGADDDDDDLLLEGGDDDDGDDGDDDDPAPA